jgi:hypothetical protein
MAFDPDYPNGDRNKMWAPLVRFAERYADDPLAPPIVPCEYMYMGAEVGRPVIYLYKHKDTRRYLNLTARGRVAWWVPPPDNGPGEYVFSRRGVYSDLLQLQLYEFGGCWDRGDYCEDCQSLLDRRRAVRYRRAV